MWRPDISPGPRLVLAIAVFVFSVLLAATAAQAAAEVTLIRVYNSDHRGTVFEVCKGEFNPPVTDPANPAYCRGEVGYWSESQWQAYNSGRSAAGGGGTAGKAKPPRAGKGKAKVATGAAPAPGALSERPSPYGGSLDPTAVLGIENPFCGERSRLSARQLRNCRSSNSPEATYPIGNYGWDIHVSSGGFITSLFVPAVSFVLQLLSVLWLILLMALKGCLIILGFAFSLSPFTDNRMLGEMSTGLLRFFNQLTSPWLVTLFVILGAWGLYNGLLRRKTGETIGGMLMALAMMLGALWIIQAPRDTVGRVAQGVNSASLVAVSAPSAGPGNAPIRSYNDAMASVWNQMTAIPFCAMNFSDIEWCMKAKPSDEALEAARDGLDDGDAFTDQLLAGLPAAPALATEALSEDMKELFGPAPTIRDLYLRFSPSGGPRDKLWEYYNGADDEHVGLPLDIGPQLSVGGGTEGAAPDKVAMQGRSGTLTRIVMLFIFIGGLLGGLFLLFWLAMKLVMATASAFVLVLAAPLAMFFPVFGQAGRNAFTKWATTLLGAIVAKFFFSGLLGIVLLGSSVIGSSVGRHEPTLGLLAVMAFWWAVLLSREKYLSVFQLDPSNDRGAGLYRTLAGGYLGYRIAKGATSAIGNIRDERRERTSRRLDEEARRQHKGAEHQLNGQAQQRLDVATSNAEVREGNRTEMERQARELRDDAGVQKLQQDAASLDEPARQQATEKAERLRGLQSKLQAGRPQAQADRRLLNRVRENEAAGLPPHGRSEIHAAREAIRREANLPLDAPEHHWRAQAAGKEPGTPEGRRAISESLAATQSSVGAMSSERLEQVDLHHPRQPGGDQRRPESGLRRESKDSGSGPGRQSPAPKARRRWISR